MSGAPMTRALDLIAFPFDSAQVIEASAGTGKTWTLASLYLRLVLGHRDRRPLLPPQILVMTFTEAATQELRERVRQRLASAAEYFRGRETDATRKDSFLPRLRADYPAELWPRCALQLELAAQWMDEAAIYTIHGWSSRMLRQHAFDSASLFEQEKLEDPVALTQAAVRDYWRRWIYPLDAMQSDAIDAFAAGPDALLEKIRPRLLAFDTSPENLRAATAAAAQTPDHWFAAWSVWRVERRGLEGAARECWRTHRAEIETLLREAMGRDLKGNIYRAEGREGYLETMRQWSEGEELAMNELLRFSTEKLRASLKKGGREVPDVHGAFAALQRVCEQAPAPSLDALYAHAAAEVRERCLARKRELAQFDFNDLLQRLYDALQAPDGRLAHAIAAQYPVALVDEFQDTDPWQYGALRRIYLDEPEPGTALVMIGDPKQAIYSFRGADLKTYLLARDTAAAVHTLTGNYRSTAGLVAAVNRVFEWAEKPFAPIRYEAVSAHRPDLRPLVHAGDQVQPAMTVWYVEGSAATGAQSLRQQIAAAFATQIVSLLSEHIVEPADIAVLVRSAPESQLIREALGARALRSVYLSDRDSVYATAEAQDLWYILRAIAEPRLASAVRTALTTQVFGYTSAELDALFADEARFEAEVDQFARWQILWQRQGFLAMLYAVLHEQGIPSRLLERTDGERRLTNLLHLGDLLQKIALELQGERAIVRYLAEQLRVPSASGESAQLRLETDADLVKIITVHKAKGLQYPVVFVPFAYEFRPREVRVAEDIRLLYVALTRAERALYVGAATRSGDFSDETPRSALSVLLRRESVDDLPQRLAAWAECEHIHVAPLPPSTPAAYRAVATSAPWRGALVPRRSHVSLWRSVSFSSLTRRGVAEYRQSLPLAVTDADERLSDAQEDSTPVDAADTSEGIAYNAFPAGARYGDLLHGLLEWQLAAAWPILRAPEDAAWASLFARRTATLGIGEEHRLLLQRWIKAIALCPLDVGAATPVRLAELAPAQTWAEMGFTLTTHGVDAREIDGWVSAQILAGGERERLAPGTLEGLLTGFLDLLFEHDGRYYVLDYKSNRLPGYDSARLQAAMLEHRYDLQYALYLVALHRLLKARLPDYDYERHVGGAVYLFARGLDLPGHGVFHDRPPQSLITALDAAFRETPR